MSDRKREDLDVDLFPCWRGDKVCEYKYVWDHDEFTILMSQSGDFEIIHNYLGSRQEDYLTGDIRWDGCMHLFGKYQHFCEVRDAAIYGKLILAAYYIAGIECWINDNPPGEFEILPQEHPAGLTKVREMENFERRKRAGRD